jgi:hypothetical protein
MGDAGSLSLGTALAVLIVLAGSERSGRVDILVPLLGLAFPLLDTAIAILRRWLRGDSFSRADSRHIHHQLVALGLSQPRAAGLLIFVSAVAALLALPLSFARPTVILGLGTAMVLLAPVAVVYSVGLLNYHEFFEARASLMSGARKARSVIRDRIRAHEMAADLAHAPTFAELSSVLQDRRSAFVFDEISLRPKSTPSSTPAALESRSLVWEGDGLPTGAWRFQYTISEQTKDGVGPFLLEIRSHDHAGTSSAERIARILGPAIAGALPNVRYYTDRTDDNAASARTR